MQADIEESVVSEVLYPYMGDTLVMKVLAFNDLEWTKFTEFIKKYDVEATRPERTANPGLRLKGKQAKISRLFLDLDRFVFWSKKLCVL